MFAYPVKTRRVVRTGEDHPRDAPFAGAFVYMIGSGHVNGKHLAKEIVLILRPAEMKHRIHALQRRFDGLRVRDVQLFDAAVRIGSDVGGDDVVPLAARKPSAKQLPIRPAAPVIRIFLFIDECPPS